MAQAKIAPERIARIAREELARQGRAVLGARFPQARHRRVCQLLPPLLARPILHISACRGWLGRVYFGMEINSTSIAGYLRFLMLAKLRPLPAIRPPLQAGAEGDRGLARADRRGGAAIDRPRARSCRMRAADQGLWRHACAWHRQLHGDRDARDPPGLGGPYPARAGRRCDRQRANRGAGRSRGRRSGQVPSRNRGPRQPADGGGIDAE